MQTASNKDRTGIFDIEVSLLIEQIMFCLVEKVFGSFRQTGSFDTTRE
jgi:hypothetical protein